MNILVLHGPNLNTLGHRETDIYGTHSFADLSDSLDATATRLGVKLTQLQSNHEGQIVDWIHQAREAACGIVIKPGAYSHTSIAILDALNAFEAPVMEVHISQIHKRETFRHHSYVSHRADAVIAGLGLDGYVAGVRRICSLAGAAG